MNGHSTCGRCGLRGGVPTLRSPVRCGCPGEPAHYVPRWNAWIPRDAAARGGRAAALRRAVRRALGELDRRPLAQRALEARGSWRT